MKSLTLIPLIALALVGCEPQPATESLPVTSRLAETTNQVEKVEQFTVTSKGKFKAGYDNAEREIFILTDNFTGEKYLGVTDCALIKLIEKKNEAAAEAMESALDIVGSAFDE